MQDSPTASPTASPAASPTASPVRLQVSMHVAQLVGATQLHGQQTFELTLQPCRKVSLWCFSPCAEVLAAADPPDHDVPDAMALVC